MVVTNSAVGGVFSVGATTATSSVGSNVTVDFSGLSNLTIALDPGSGIVRVGVCAAQLVGERTESIR